MGTNDCHDNKYYPRLSILHTDELTVKQVSSFNFPYCICVHSSLVYAWYLYIHKIIIDYAHYTVYLNKHNQKAIRFSMHKLTADALQ